MDFVAKIKSHIHYLVDPICWHNSLFHFTKIKLTLLDLFSVTIQKQGPVTPNKGAISPVLRFTAAVTEIPGTAVSTGQGSLPEG